MGEMLIDRRIYVDYESLSFYYAYKRYCKGLNITPVPNPIYNKIISEYNKAILKELLYGLGSYKMGNGVGELKIVKIPVDFDTVDLKKIIDPVLSKKYKKAIYFINDHSGNHRYSIIWKKGLFVKRRVLYSFTPARKFKRELAYVIKNKINDFFYG